VSEPIDEELSFRLFVDGVIDYAIFLLSPTGHVRSWNAGARRIKQYEAHEIIGKHFSIFYTPADVERKHPEEELAIATREGRFEEEGWRVRKDGTLFWANVVITRVQTADGKLIGFAKLTRDLTERRKAEQERLRLAESEAALKLRDEFLSIASHELKTPLTSLQLQLSGMQRLFRKQPLQHTMMPRLNERLEVLDREVDRIVRLVDDLLDVSRAASGHLHLDLERVNLAGVVRVVVDRFETDLARAGCTVSLSLDDSLEGQWDRLRLDQVVTNFLSNAIKYGPDKPIVIEVARHDGSARLTVRDQGIGIEPADQERIFDRFTRAVPATNYGGLGLGLWIVRVLVEAMRGTVGVASEPGQGATFTMTLPVD
jgi:PAS domain S-box-containing protein